ncbi:hypothetical protein AABB24_006838 [Solanum stoloniferum]|uniref:Uncharacterized protein n=1 Tax=Solanum stoloniferum TaxID=62892 RepID=A0ABD2V352_9SOLN
MKYLLKIKADMSHVKKMTPNGGVDSGNMPYFFKLRCEHCDELSKRQCVYMSGAVNYGRDVVNHVLKCKGCKETGAVTLISGYGRDLTVSGAYAPLMLFKCTNGLVPEGYEFNGGWTLTTDSNKVIMDVNLVSNSFYGNFDEYGNQPTIKNTRGKFTLYQEY